jgi:hypothetical protein
MLENRKSEPKRTMLATAKRPSLLDMTSPKEQFDELSKRLAGRYFTSKSRAEIASPYAKRRTGLESGHAKVRFRPVHKS